MTTTTSTSTARPVVYVVPCSGPKLDTAAPARELYTGSHFRNALQVAETMAAEDGGTVLILSALHGLISTDAVLAPYDVTVGAAGAATPSQVLATAAELGLIDADAELFALLPTAYYELLAAALAPVFMFAADIYEAAGPGVGFQRSVIKSCRTSYAA